MIYLFYIFKSRYCRAIFLLGLGGGYLGIPKNVLYGKYLIISLLFLLLFSLLITCIIRNIKEKILLAKTYKNSILGIIAVAIGLSALQVCGVGAPVCGAAIGWGVVSAILPTVALGALEQYAIYFITGSMLLQLITLYFMNCFKNQISVSELNKLTNKTKVFSNSTLIQK